jgi:hypothetical protein
MAKTREIDQKQEKKFGLFDFVSDITEFKKYRFDEDTKSVYNSFMVNRALMQHIDTILLANEMNKRPDLIPEMSHDFLFYSVDAKSRYGKWAKKSDDNLDLINYIRSHYKINYDHAIMYINLMTEDELKQIEFKMNAKGGKS